MKGKRIRPALSKISKFHYGKLFVRTALFIIVAIVWLIKPETVDRVIAGQSLGGTIALLLIWLIYMVEMLMRMFPARLESMGCQRQFNRNYRPTGHPPVKPKNQTRAVFFVILAWVLLNAVFGVLYYVGIFDEGVLMLISLAYSVCDMICILLFCPFQMWFLKNKCCTTCRIYNWDFAMMFTPLIFVGGLYSLTLCGMALLLLIRWEINYACHPERFYECSNDSLNCANCQERLCNQKKSIQRIRKQLMVGLKEELVEIKEGLEDLKEEIKKELRKK